MITLDKIPRRNPAVASQVMDGEAVLVHPQKGKVKVLNAVGAQIWQALDGRRPVSEVAAAICKAYGIPTAQAETDTLAFLESLLSHELIAIDAS